MNEDLDDLGRPIRGARDLMTDYQRQWYESTGRVVIMNTERARRMRTSGHRLRGKSGYAILDDAAFGHWPGRSAPFDAAVIDSLIRGFPIGMITILRALSGADVVEIVIDGAKRLAAIHRHVHEAGGGLLLDFEVNAVVCEHAVVGPSTWPTHDILGDRMASWTIASGLAARDQRMANRVENVSNAVADGVVNAQTVITDEIDLLACRLGHADRVAWIRAQIEGSP